MSRRTVTSGAGTEVVVEHHLGQVTGELVSFHHRGDHHRVTSRPGAAR